MKTDGNEKLYELTEDEAYPVLCVSETKEKYRGEDGVIAIPERLIKRLEDARAAERTAVNEIARWVKYGPSATARADISRIISELPTTDEWKAERKKR